jgi:heterodisulfide reductase subunit B
MKIGFFPGCSLEGTAKEYQKSLLKISSLAGIELIEVDDWNCCGATAAHSLNHLLSIALPARILALAELQGFSDLLIPCAACYSRLITARNVILRDDKIKNKILEIIELPFENKVNPINVIEFINKYLSEFIKSNLKFSINQKVACYYGCLLVRPPKVLNVERYEDPQDMESIVKILGGKPINWAYKVECCGAGLSVSRTEIVAKLSAKIIEDAESRGAEAIIVACPMCQSNLDMRRNNIKKFLQRKSILPVLYITQLIGMSLGISEDDLGLKKHFVPVKIKLDETNNKVKEVKLKEEKEVLA